jgi:hypothetical protein
MSYHDTHSKTQQPYGRAAPPKNRAREIDVHETMKKEMYQQAGVPDQEYGQVSPYSNLTPALAAVMAGTGYTPPPGVSVGVGAPVSIPSSLPSSLPYSIPGPSAQQILINASKSNEGSQTSSSSAAPTGVFDRFFFLDSSARDPSSDIVNGKLAYSVQTLNQSKPLSNIIEMEVGQFYFPDIVVGANYPTYFFFKRLYIRIEEMAAQAVFAQNNNRYHFELGIQPAGISNSTVDIGFNKFIFGKAFQDLSVATLYLTTSPNFKAVNFAQDTFTFTSVAGSNPATITCSLPHGITIASQASVYISGFSSNVSNVDSVINAGTGHLLTATTTTQLQFAPAVLVFDVPFVPATSGTLVIGVRRIAFTIRFRTLSSETTNQIVPV